MSVCKLVEPNFIIWSYLTYVMLKNSIMLADAFKSSE